MLERFDQLKNCVKKALLDFVVADSIQLIDFEYQKITDLVNVLRPIKVTVDALCRSDANLITADIALEFMFSKLIEFDTEISQQLFLALSMRIKERRTDLSSLLQFLHHGHNKVMMLPDIFLLSTNTKNKKIMIDLLNRLNASNLQNESGLNEDFGETSSEDDFVIETSELKSMSEQLSDAIQKGLVSKKNSSYQAR